MPPRTMSIKNPHYFFNDSKIFPDFYIDYSRILSKISPLTLSRIFFGVLPSMPSSIYLSVPFGLYSSNYSQNSSTISCRYYFSFLPFSWNSFGDISRNFFLHRHFTRKFSGDSHQNSSREFFPQYLQDFFQESFLSSFLPLF